MASLTWRELKKMIEQGGWLLKSTRGSHRKYRHPNRPGMVILAYHSLGDDVPIGTLKQILKDAGLAQ